MRLAQSATLQEPLPNLLDLGGMEQHGVTPTALQLATNSRTDETNGSTHLLRLLKNLLPMRSYKLRFTNGLQPPFTPFPKCAEFHREENLQLPEFVLEKAPLLWLKTLPLPLPLEE